MWKKLRKDNKKGFTLVELIVVLVILAILAALLIPALTGYIKKAKEKQIIAETRQTVMAAQTLVDEYYGKTDMSTKTGAITVEESGDIEKSAVATLAEVVEDNITSITVGEDDLAGTVVKVVYERDDMTCTYEKTSVTEAGTYTMS